MLEFLKRLFQSKNTSASPPHAVEPDPITVLALTPDGKEKVVKAVDADTAKTEDDSGDSDFTADSGEDFDIA